MKRNGKTLLFCLVAAFGGLVTACEKDEPMTRDPIVSEEEAAAVIEGALVAEAEGIAKEVEDAATVADDYEGENLVITTCGQGFDTTVVRTYNTARITADYSTNWSWEVTCNAFDAPETFLFSRSIAGGYESLRMISDDTASGSWSVGNLSTGFNYVFNGVYTRSGSQESKVRNQNVFTSTLTITVTDLEVAKVTKLIKGGAGTFIFSGTGANGESFAFNGAIEFLGDGAATIVINGNTYEVDLY